MSGGKWLISNGGGGGGGMGVGVGGGGGCKLHLLQNRQNTQEINNLVCLFTSD